MSPFYDNFAVQKTINPDDIVSIQNLYGKFHFIPDSSKCATVPISGYWSPSPLFLIPAPLHLLSSSFRLHFISFLPHSSSSSSPFFLIPAPRYASLCICFLSEKSDGLLSLSLWQLNILILFSWEIKTERIEKNRISNLLSLYFSSLYNFPVCESKLHFISPGYCDS